MEVRKGKFVWPTLGVLIALCWFTNAFSEKGAQSLSKEILPLPCMRDISLKPKNQNTFMSTRYS